MRPSLSKCESDCKGSAGKHCDTMVVIMSSVRLLQLRSRLQRRSVKVINSLMAVKSSTSRPRALSIRRAGRLDGRREPGDSVLFSEPGTSEMSKYTSCRWYPASKKLAGSRTKHHDTLSSRGG